MSSTFDHRQCPNCANSTMRLTCVEPHNPDRDDGYEWHVYHCTECRNVSRFVFDVCCRASERRSSADKAPLSLQNIHSGYIYRFQHFGATAQHIGQSCD
jgi:hypothetical protein